MKKTILLLMMALLCLCVRAQEPLVFNQVIEKEGKTSEQLYSLIKKWVTVSYKSAKDVIQLDEPGKELTMKAKIDFKVRNLTWAAASGYIDYTVDFLIKDNRFKVIIGPFSHVSTQLEWGAAWSNGIVYKEKPDDKTFEKIGVKKIARRQYRAIDERVRPVIINEIETIVHSLIDYLDNRGKPGNDEWDF